MAEQLELVAEGDRDSLLLVRGLGGAHKAGATLDELEEYVRERAGIDPVTGLDARRRFEGRLRQELKRAARARHATAVAVFDLRPGDRLGAEAIAAATRQAAAILVDQLRDIDTVARLEGTRFAALLPMCSSHPAGGAADRALRALSAIEGTSPVAGVASTDETSGWDLLEFATTATAGEPGQPVPPAG